MSVLGQKRTLDKLGSAAIRIASTTPRGTSKAKGSGQNRSPCTPLPAPTSNGTHFPDLASLLGPEGKSHTTLPHASSSSLQGKGASCQLCLGQVGC
jgi:hypothetical protein